MTAPRGRHGRGPVPVQPKRHDDAGKWNVEDWLLPFALGFFVGCTFVAAGMWMFWV